LYFKIMIVEISNYLMATRLTSGFGLCPAKPKIGWLHTVLRPALKFFLLHRDTTIVGEGLQNLGLCSALRAFEQEGVFIVPLLLWHVTLIFAVLSEGPPPFSRFLWHTCTLSSYQTIAIFISTLHVLNCVWIKYILY
jgi:hypothetical protein